MKSFIKIVKYLLQPWSTIYKSKISSIAKAVIVGCSVSFMLWAVGWTLFSSSPDLRHRNVVSVLVSPDVRTIEGQSDISKIIGVCSPSYGDSPPREGFVEPLYAIGPNYARAEQKICKNWIKDGPYFSWTATKYLYIRGFPTYRTGNSRTDALDHVIGVWVDAVSLLFTPLIVLIVMQTGVLVGYQYFRRSPETNTSDEDIS